MSELNAKRRLRAGNRTVVSRIIPKVADAVEKYDTSDESKATLRKYKIMLSEKQEKLKELNEAIFNLISSQDNTEEALVKEMDEADSFSEKIIEALVEIEEKLKDVSIGSLGSYTGSRESLVSGDFENSNQQPKRKQIRAKLPKLQLKKFSGKASDWQEFWDSYSCSIHINNEVAVVDKFNYLRGYLEEPARSVIAGFKTTEGEYEAAIKLLHERYARPAVIKRAHLNELLNIEAVYEAGNVTKLRALHDKIETHYRGLETLGIDQDSYSSIVVPAILDKIPYQIRLEMVRGAGGRSHENWSVLEMLEALKFEVNIRETFQPIFKQGVQTRTRTVADKKEVTTGSALLAAKIRRCLFCNEDHSEENCTKVNDFQRRKTLARKAGACFNCLKKGHRAFDCYSSQRCNNCKSKHHVAICSKFDKTSQEVLEVVESRDSNQVKSNATKANHTNANSCSSESGSAGERVALQTAQAVVHGVEGKARVRVLFDSGSHKSFITVKVVERMKLVPLRSEMLGIKAFGVSEAEVRKRDVVNVTMSSADGKETMNVHAYVVDKISSIANEHVETIKHKFDHLKDLWFSDVNRSDDDLEVDILIGSDKLWTFQEGQLIRGGPDDPVAVKTKLGWVLSGPLRGEKISVLEQVNVNINHVATTLAITDNTHSSSMSTDFTAGRKHELAKSIHKLWDLESVGIRPTDKVYEDTIDNIEFNGERYSVKLPWKMGHKPLPTNFLMSLSRMKNQIKRLKNEPEILQQYQAIIDEQLNNGIIEKVSELESEGNEVCYLPHQPVVRKDAETTKVRMVFDASCKEGKGGTSLNDCLHVGPPLTPLLFNILLRFRENKVALVGDIEKAFLMIEVHPSDRDCLRFLWVKDTQKEPMSVEVYRFKRVVFGVNSSPFLLNATLRHHIDQYASQDQEFVTKLKNSFYVDDLVGGSKDAKDAIELYEKAKTRMLEGGFRLRKWKTNDDTVRQHIQMSENCEEEKGVETGEVNAEDVTYAKETLGIVEEVSGKTKTKILGVSWDIENDVLEFDLGHMVKETKNPITKRGILSSISKIFDPLGVVSPVTVGARVLFQDLCKQNIGWDEEITEEQQKIWNNWLESLLSCKEIRVPRCLYPNNVGEVLSCYLHGFADASNKAYCASIYLVYQTATGFHSQLVCSKTRVSPIKKMTIPRLELMSARILVSLMDTVYKALENQVKIDGVKFWLDSKTALYWIRNKGEWKQFVAHRVTEILTVSSADDWGHCPGIQNPADIGSRGVTPFSLVESKLWWEGPEWLVQGYEFWPKSITLEDSEFVKQEEKKCTTTVLIVDETKPLIDADRFSSFNRLLKTTSWIHRFVNNLKKKIKGNEINLSELDRDEISRAKMYWVVQAQKQFHESRNMNKVKQLGVFKDDGILKCKGRLEHSDLEVSSKFPILLSNDHYFTELLIMNCHRKVHHGGVRATLAELRHNYWIPKGRQVVKKVLRKCFTCKRLEGKSYGTPPTSALPDFRVQESPPFSKTGVDFAGPLFVKAETGKMEKVYIALFTCSVTRAVHLELVGDLSTVTFLNCLRRFAARRGTPTMIVSDNAKTFKATDRYLTKLYKDVSVSNMLSQRGITWRFNLERSPWWGVFFERLVRSVKRSLRKVLGQSKLNFDELSTILTEIESTLNNRPLTYLYDEVGEEALTPSHLMHGRRLQSVSDISDNTFDNINCNKRYSYLLRLLQHFWNRWRREYVTDLREVHKNLTGEIVNCKEGDVVLIMDDSVKRSLWKMGKVNRTITGKDGVLRGAEVKVMTRGKPMFVCRPLQKLYPLEISSSVRELNESVSNAMNGEPKEREETEVTAGERPQRAAACDARWKTRMMLDV